jgi:hypothetical protein
MKLGDKQRLFARMLPRLIDKAYDLGYEITLGEAWRSPETAAMYAEQGKGIRFSLHGTRLAIDLNLFKDGTYLTATEDHRTLGEWWEDQSFTAEDGTRIDCCWGGRFGDGNHYSIAHGGRK